MQTPLNPNFNTVLSKALEQQKESKPELVSKQAVLKIIHTYMENLKMHIGTPNDCEEFAFARGVLTSIEFNIVNDLETYTNE